MEFFDWTEKYSVNNSIIDKQHKNLVDMLNKMYDAMSSGQGNDVIAQILSELISYTRTHFSTEERLMDEKNYPELELHKQKHTAMTKKVMDFNNQLSQGNNVSTITFGNFLKDWLQKHILETDMKYKSYLSN